MPKFETTHPVTMYHEGPDGDKDAALISDLVKEQIDIGGVAVYVWLMEGTFDQKDQKGEVATQIDEGADGLGIQDKVFLENRDRKYADDAVRLKGTYTVSQNELDFARFGVQLSNDVLQMEFHKEEMERLCGRRMKVGDVVEMPHLRDVGFDGRPMNKYYKVDSLTKSPGGWDATYNWHVLALTMTPVRDAQEFIDLMERETTDGSTVRDRISQRDVFEEVTAEIQDAAFEQAYTTWHDNTAIYIDPDLDTVSRRTDDGVPPNGIEVTKVSSFPGTPTEGDYVLRIDMYPNRLYRYQAGKWLLKEIDRKREWNTYNWTAKLRSHMTDRSAEDDMRPWEYVSIHDLYTPRHDRSEPSPKAKSGVDRIPEVGSWKPWFNYPSMPAAGGSSGTPSTISPTSITLPANTSTPLDIDPSLNEDSGAYENVLIQYVAVREDEHEFGEIMISDTGTDTDFRHEYTQIDDDIGLTFSVTHSGSKRKLQYVTTAGEPILFKFRIVERW
jgi:hypothetical protein